MNLVTLHCASGDHQWQRPSQRGRKPANCPAHADPKATVAATHTRVAVSVPDVPATNSDIPAALPDATDPLVTGEQRAALLMAKLRARGTDLATVGRHAQ